MDFPAIQFSKLLSFLLFLWTCQIQSKTAVTPVLSCLFGTVLEAVLVTGCELGKLGFQ